MKRMLSYRGEFDEDYTKGFIEGNSIDSIVDRISLNFLAPNSKEIFSASTRVEMMEIELRGILVRFLILDGDAPVSNILCIMYFYD